jgi:hypothetical protein
MTTIDPLMTTLRQRFATPQAVVRTLGMDERLLVDARFKPLG